ncbi:MAG: polysaccharide deacetylase family protein [Desulfobacterales bacterium]|nr:polysaccharide deacetylase family protein [Desulfobacterales bacterium]
MSEAIDRLKNHTLPDNSLVITIDDGFYSTYSIAKDIIRQYKYPCTIYVTTYYANKQTPILNLADQYISWKTKETYNKLEYQKIEKSRILSILNEKEIKILEEEGFDIQLHTHRHRFPINDAASAKKEIEDNKAFLEKIVKTRLIHFCYPSGIWDKSHLPYLKSMDIESAVTCVPGFVDNKSNLLLLNRFLDSENISKIEFIAEIMGFMDIVRNFIK